MIIKQRNMQVQDHMIAWNQLVGKDSSTDVDYCNYEESTGRKRNRSDSNSSLIIAPDPNSNSETSSQSTSVSKII